MSSDRFKQAVQRSTDRLRSVIVPATDNTNVNAIRKYYGGGIGFRRNQIITSEPIALEKEKRIEQNMSI